VQNLPFPIGITTGPYLCRATASDFKLWIGSYFFSLMNLYLSFIAYVGAVYMHLRIPNSHCGVFVVLSFDLPALALNLHRHEIANA